MPSSRGSSRPRHQTGCPALQADSAPFEPQAGLWKTLSQPCREVVAQVCLYGVRSSGNASECPQPGEQEDIHSLSIQVWKMAERHCIYVKEVFINTQSEKVMAGDVYGMHGKTSACVGECR